ncbi:primosomal protein N' (replication factor Y) [Methylopila capsulata]|uniref:Replication restart protein PriA n=1 Tax=Methylopila capsulata TaxID=61654 RepID=A0A9W6ISA1_9HYPH|nr:primosomal protein N' (replication factor Y) [Methylopila capsulata]GLK54444.1 primosomal protein N' [Methylopila capsulata]
MRAGGRRGRPQAPAEAPLISTFAPPTVEVLLPVGLDRALTYAVPEGVAVGPGALVIAPLGRRLELGVVWDGAPPQVDASRLKTLEGVVDAPPLSEAMRRFVDWIAEYTLAPRGQVLRMALRGLDLGAAEPKPKIGVRATGQAPSRRTPARDKALAAASDGRVRAKAELAEAAGVSTSVVDGLLADGALQAATLPPPPRPPQPDPHRPGPPLSDAQASAANALAALAGARRFHVALVDGVTGSGKTEVYLEAVAAALKAGRQALVMAPEIALTGALLDRFADRFGARPAVWHASVGDKRRSAVRRGVASGEIRVVVAARSGLFLPFADLGLIVVDEEHDASYKQEEGVFYNARDMAVLRGRFEQAAVVLASATPSLESRVNAERGRYAKLALPDRFGGRALPRIEAIDMRTAGPPRGQWLAPKLVSAMIQTLAAGEQTLLFLNRRGYAPLTLCRACGHRMKCPNCSAWLVEHRFQARLVCHHCGHTGPTPRSCPSCGTADALVACGPGVERIRDEAQARFPEARIAILSSDLIAGGEALRAELDAIARGDVDIVVGTQMVTKGHNFPNLTLVGAVDADFALGAADPRAGERTFQILEQVAGRAGRGDRPGRALLQTHEPEHPVIKALVAADREGFYRVETAARQAAGMPPFGRLAALIVSGTTRETAEAHARVLARAAPKAEGVRVLGPAEAPLAMVRGRHRIRLLVQAGREVDVPAYLRAWLAAAAAPRGGVRVAVDVDPQSFV